ncbi:hypothetical protein [Secundilactobacillus malefermentans]|uniref:hypothetical protein n=1 Tax=Secundilactobacillus malefermentans TaxID=176292 RepID=UPI0011C7B3BC|nr:hypothetical protein [Secundilactobacillus malefermentans]QEA32127.1 hypothetical protein FGL90_07990 [Secundilactobacillus malefermentans]
MTQLFTNRIDKYKCIQIKPLSKALKQREVPFSFNLEGQLLEITKTACNYGGWRYWFVCPSCQKRFTALYCKNERWMCRKCHGLLYRDQIEEKQPKYIQSFHNAIRVARKIDPQFNVYLIEFIQQYGNMFPMKPRGMHVQTYARLKFEYYQQIELMLNQMNALTISRYKHGQQLKQEVDSMHTKDN